MEEFSHAECFFHIFIGIHRCNAAACRAELFIGKTLLFKAIKFDVIRHRNDRSVADF